MRRDQRGSDLSASVVLKRLHLHREPCKEVVEGRRIEVNRATPRAKPLPVSQFLSFHQVNHQSQMLQLVEAQTRLAEAQLAVLQMRNAILNPQVKLLIN